MLESVFSSRIKCIGFVRVKRYTLVSNWRVEFLSSVVFVVISPSISPSVSKATKIDVEKILDFFLHFVKSFGGVKISHFYH